MERAAPLRCKWKDITFLDFVAGFRFVGKNLGTDLPVPRRRPAIVGHRNFSPDLQPEEFYYAKLLLHTVWTEPGDWLQEDDCGSHTAAFHRIAMDTDRYPNFLQSTCFPMLDGTVQAARQLQAVQSVMFLKAKMDTRGAAHSRAAENNYKDSMRIMQALKARHGEDIGFLAPDNVHTGPATDIYAPVEGGEALCTSVQFLRTLSIFSRPVVILCILVGGVEYTKAVHVRIKAKCKPRCFHQPSLGFYTWISY